MLKFRNTYLFYHITLEGINAKDLQYTKPHLRNTKQHVSCFRCWEAWRLGGWEDFYNLLRNSETPNLPISQQRKQRGAVVRTKDRRQRTKVGGLWTLDWWGEASRRAVTARPEGSPHPTARYVRNKSSAVTSDWTIDEFSLRFTPFIVTSVRCTADSVPVSSLNTAILFASFLA